MGTWNIENLANDIAADWLADFAESPSTASIGGVFDRSIKSFGLGIFCIR